ncbi:pectin lyase fold/virulence factor [Fusarium solani]|uniref:Pectin lyase fold/virulence factor n=1 Tax=Fusarium solani TaxID=169388 RepID=A0A9P9GX43_FUSSL|nr:pectin lyase fold/virulence factor [Fusarium solani]KAH7247159.1 pectin lyase fold/virulence factor [Fusarium solani]
MFISLVFWLFVELLAVSSVQAAKETANSIITYPIPSGVQNSTAFEVKINPTTGSRSYYQSSMVYFDFNGTVEIAATWAKERPQEVRVRPDSYSIKAQKSGRSVGFTLDRPRDVVLQINGEIFDVLHIFTNPPPVDEPSPDDPDAIYYGPGFHSVSGEIQVPSGKTLYIAGGSVVSVEAIEFTNVTNAAVRGHGVLTYPRSGNIFVTRSQNVAIDGLIGLNFMAWTFEATDIDIKNWRSFSSVQWGDGIDLFCSQNILIDSVFVRSADDSVAIYNHRDAWYGDVKNITIQNSSLWADVAHPINVGSHGNTANPETASDITIRNDILIEDVRVENFRLGRLLNFRVMFNEKYNTSPGRGIRNVVIRNLNYNGEGSITSLFSGYDAERTISNVTFYKLTVNGQVITDSMKRPGWYLTTDFIPLHVNDHVHNLTFKA